MKLTYLDSSSRVNKFNIIRYLLTYDLDNAKAKRTFLSNMKLLTIKVGAETVHEINLDT
jgi:hypothetical protein